MSESISTNPSIHEDTLNLLFGEGTDAKTGLDKLKEQVEYERLPEALKDTIVKEKVEEKVEQEKQVEKDTISSHNSTRLVEDLPITKNTDEETEEISSHNSSRVLEEKEITQSNIQDMNNHNFFEN